MSYNSRCAEKTAITREYLNDAISTTLNTSVNRLLYGYISMQMLGADNVYQSIFHLKKLQEGYFPRFLLSASYLGQDLFDSNAL